VVLALLLGSVVEFGYLFSHKLELANAARSGARWGSLHSSSWSAGTTPPSNTIEGQVRAAGGTALLPNDDSHLLIEYLDVSGSTQTLCGHYSAGGAAFVAAGAYSQATCVVPGSMVRVTLTNAYSLVTGLLGPGVGTAVTVRAVAVMPVTA
jgi:hypothetical protein